MNKLSHRNAYCRCGKVKHTPCINERKKSPYYETGFPFCWKRWDFQKWPTVPGAPLFVLPLKDILIRYFTINKLFSIAWNRVGKDFRKQCTSVSTARYVWKSSKGAVLLCDGCYRTQPASYFCSRCCKPQHFLLSSLSILHLQNTPNSTYRRNKGKFWWAQKKTLGGM